MAVVVSQEQNEAKKFKAEGLDITSHRKRMVKEDLAEKFKDPDDFLQIVFVCNMWMTGFDVPSLSTIYMDKPLKNHALMQAIARANRVFKEKQAGFIVDYSNIFRDLKKALAIYAPSTVPGYVDLPIESKDKLVGFLRDFIKDMDNFLLEQKIDPSEIIASHGLDKLALLDQAQSNLVANENLKKNFLEKAGIVTKTYSAILPHRDASEFSATVALYQELVKEIRSLDPRVDISSVVHAIESVLDKSVATEGYVIDESQEVRLIDLRSINFEKLRRRFEERRNNADIERLKNILSFNLKEMVRLNSSRIDYQEKFQKLIDDYNSGSSNHDKYLDDLVRFGEHLSEEERRALGESLTEEQLALFDKLRKSVLSETDKDQLKKVAKNLLADFATS